MTKKELFEKLKIHGFKINGNAYGEYEMAKDIFGVEYSKEIADYLRI